MTSSHYHASTGSKGAKAAGTVDADVAALAQRVTAAEARITVLEAPQPASQPAPTGPTPTLDITFDNGVIDSRLVPIYVVGDPGYGADSDFLGSLAQCSVVNGALRITAERKATPSGRAYASACIGTKGTWSQLYGTLEARIRYPGGQGTWPALWMLAAGKNVSPPEIDNFEAYPAMNPRTLVQTNHWAGEPLDPGQRTDSWREVSAPAQPDLTQAFHVHRLVWTPTALMFSIDGVETFRVTSHVPTVPMYPIVTLAMGTGGYRVDATTPSPLFMDVDYLRAFAA